MISHKSYPNSNYEYNNGSHAGCGPGPQTRKRDTVIQASWTETRRGSYLKLVFRLNIADDNKGSAQDASGEVMPGPFNIDELAQVRFKIVQISPDGEICDDDPVLIKISSKLSESVLNKHQGQIIYLNISSKELKVAKELVCSKEWLDWIDIGEIELSAITFRIPCVVKPFELTMIVSKKETVTFSKLNGDTKLTDFQLSTTEGGVAFHKVLLAAHSDVIKTMFCNEWKETANAIIHIQNVTFHTLQDLKKYIYLNTLPDKIEELRSLLVVASFYEMEILMSECISMIIRKLTSENLQSLLEFACANNIPKLIFAMMEQIPSQLVHDARLNRNIYNEGKDELTEQQSLYVSSIDIEEEVENKGKEGEEEDEIGENDL